MFGVLKPKVPHLVCHLPEGLLHCSHCALCEAIPELGASMNEFPGRVLLCCLAPSLHECPHLC